MSFTVVGTILWGFLDTYLRYRFLDKMLGSKIQYTYLWFYVGNVLYGQINVRLSLAVTLWGNLIYLCGCAFLLNVLLFYGSVIKKVFFTLWMYCGAELVCDMFLILFDGLAIRQGEAGCSDMAISVASIIASIVQFTMMEVLQRKLCILKQDFENQDALYLMPVILFIYAAVSMMTAMFGGVGDWTSKTVLAMAVPCILVAFGGAVLHVYCIVRLDASLAKRLESQQYQMMGRHMEALAGQYEQMMKIRHDIRNHGLCLAQLLSEEKTKEAVKYLEELNIRMETGKPAVQTGSVFADALLNPKCQQAKEWGIDMDISMRVPGEEQIRAADLCCILANALDNAMEACKRGGDARKSSGWIKVRAGMHGDYWVLEVKNSVFSPVSVQEGRVISEKHTSGHGIGLQNIRAVVGRYGGVLDMKSDSCFVLSVMLPLPSAAEK